MLRRQSKIWISISLMISLVMLPGGVLADTGIPFGGQIIVTIPCLCSLNLLIIQRPIGKTSPPTLMFDFASILHAFYNIWTPGTYLMGNYGIPEACVQPVGEDGACVPVWIAPRIIRVGTS